MTALKKKKITKQAFNFSEGQEIFTENLEPGMIVTNSNISQEFPNGLMITFIDRTEKGQAKLVVEEPRQGDSWGEEFEMHVTSNEKFKVIEQEDTTMFKKKTTLAFTVKEITA